MNKYFKLSLDDVMNQDRPRKPNTHLFDKHHDQYKDHKLTGFEVSFRSTYKPEENKKEGDEEYEARQL